MKRIILFLVFIICFLCSNIVFSSEPTVQIGNKTYSVIEKNALDSLEAHSKILQANIDSAHNRIDDVYKNLNLLIIMIVASYALAFSGSIMAGFFMARKQTKKDLENFNKEINNLRLKAKELEEIYNNIFQLPQALLAINNKEEEK